MKGICEFNEGMCGIWYRRPRAYLRLTTCTFCIFHLAFCKNLHMIRFGLLTPMCHRSSQFWLILKRIQPIFKLAPIKPSLTFRFIYRPTPNALLLLAKSDKERKMDPFTTTESNPIQEALFPLSLWSRMEYTVKIIRVKQTNYRSEEKSFLQSRRPKGRKERTKYWDREKETLT